jgi:putative flippase GtrA
VLQPVVITAVSFTLTPLDVKEGAALFIGKIIATGVSLVWNYIMYSRFVFKTKGK